MSELDKKISEFVEITSVGDNAVIPVVQGNPLDNYKISVENLLKLVKIPDFPDIPEGHTHPNKELLDLITQSNLDVLGKLSVDENGNIKVDTSLWATGGVSALGLGEDGEPGTGGDFDRLDKWEDYDSTKAVWILSALLGKDLDTRTKANLVSILELNTRVDEIENVDSDKNFVHIQGVSSDTWTIAHTLNKYPSVTIIDSGGTEVIGNVKYVDSSTVSITFSSAFSGRAILN